MSTDAELLQRYVEHRDERAFSEFVQTHLGLVYASALRRTGGRVHLAEDIAQQVFVDLARKAARLQRHPTLVGWLYRSTRYLAINSLRADQRKQKLAETLATMPPTAADDCDRIDWERLRPVLDAALDELSEADREVMLLRFFEGLSFVDVGARLHLSENTARMRTERALEKLRRHLGRRGVTSTAAALALGLASQALASPPAGLATSITTAALSTVPVSGGLIGFLLMSKLTVPLLSAVAASGLTALVWTSFVPGVSAGEIAALRAEHTRLAAAIAPGSSADAIAAVARDFTVPATAIAQAMTDRSAQRREANATAPTAPGATAAPAVTPRGHRDHGNATARDAGYTFAWATDIADPAVIARVIYLDPPSRERAAQILAGMPPEVRAQYPTPEDFYGLLLAASCLEAPPPGADVLETMEAKMAKVELSPGRVAFRQKTGGNFTQEYQQTSEGWKYVLPLAGVEGLPTILNNETFARLAKSTQP